MDTALQAGMKGCLKITKFYIKTLKKTGGYPHFPILYGRKWCLASNTSYGAMETGLAMGYTTVSTDTGHKGSPLVRNLPKMIGKAEWTPVIGQCI